MKIDRRIKTTSAICATCAFFRGFDGPRGMLPSIVRCGLGGRVSLASGVCLSGVWDGRDVGAPIIVNGIAPAARNGGGWIGVWRTWERARSAVASVASGLTGTRVDRRRFGLRVVSCHGSENVPPCANRKWSREHSAHYCGACGCGDKEIALLDSGSTQDAPITDYRGRYTKLHFPILSCPLKRRGFDNCDDPDGDTA